MTEPISGNALDIDDLETPICIVGGGPAGLSLSMGLTSAKVPHVLLESGGIEIGDAQELNVGQNVGRKYDLPDETRVRALAGTLNVWGGHCGPLQPHDFEKRDWIENSGWPITFDEFEPWLAPAAKSLHLENRWKADALGTEYRKHVRTGHGRFDLRTFKLAPVYGDGNPIHVGNYWQFNQPHIGARIILDTTVRHLNFSESGELETIDAVRSDGRPLRIKARHFVIAAGGIETARLLLINQRRLDGPLKAHGTIGKYFMEHPHIGNAGRTWFGVTRPHRLFFGDRFRDQSVSLWRFFLSPQAQRDYGIGGVAPYLSHISHSKTDEDSLLANVSRTRLFTEQVPNEYSQIRISDSEVDRLGDPLVQVDWQLHEQDLRTIELGVELFAHEIGIHDFGRFQAKVPTPEKPRSIRGGHHHMGTVRMADTISKGVVNRDLKVFGTNNLYLAGPGAFPTSGATNPTMNAIALSFRLAEHLAKEIS